MPTSNEMWHDGLVRRQIAISKFERELQVQLMDLLDGTERDVRLELADRLEGLVEKAFGPTTNSRLDVLARSIAKIREGAFDEGAELWDEALGNLADSEIAYLDQHLKDVTPVELDTVLPSAEQLAGIVSSHPIAGRVLSEWIDGAKAMDTTRIMDAVKMGMVQGRGTQDIIRSVMGTNSLDGADGVLEMTRSGVASLVQTSISTIASETRQAYFDANSDVFDMERWVATLDDATCEECGALDGEEFPVGEGEQPPLHFNCRCVRVPSIDGKTLGDRPANAANEDELDGLSKDDRREKIKELVGQVPASTTYTDWLGRQTDAFQDHVLGPTRAALFRDGDLKLDRFTNPRGDRYTIDQLREREPAAFRRSGIDSE